MTPFAMFQIPAWSFFRKCVVLMHFKSPFQSTMEYRHRSLAVPLVPQSLRAVLHCATAVKTFPLKKVTSGLCVFFFFFSFYC